jgi:hypothetical protein
MENIGLVTKNQSREAEANDAKYTKEVIWI